MHYYIDGYNLLFRTSNSNLTDLQAQRKSLIDSLNVKIAGLKLRVTIVFDSQFLPGEGSRGHFHHLEICFTPAGVTADDYILQELQYCFTPEKVTVVTSDKDLAQKARNYSAETKSIEEFLNWLNSRHKRLKDQKKIIKAEINPQERLSSTQSTQASLAAPEREPKPPPPGTMEYYLAQFEKALKDTKSLESLPNSGKRAKRHQKIKPIPPSYEEQLLSEEERWLKIFTDRLKTPPPAQDNGEINSE